MENPWSRCLTGPIGLNPVKDRSIPQEPSKNQRNDIRLLFMVFSSITFLFYFLPICLVGYFLLPALPIRNIFLLLASLIFYYWGEPWFVIVMLVSITINYTTGLLIGYCSNSFRIWALVAGITANLLLIGIFKYADFIIENINVLLQVFSWSLPVPKIALPLGISFFTFQAISYIIDVYRREVSIERNPLTLALYISMFPQLVAGPIVRYETVAKQLHQRHTTLGRASIGTRIFIIGLAQKVLIANEVVHMADAAFTTAMPSALEAWLGVISYTIQIYFDFAGYSNMAIGLGLIFGFTFPRNFRLPYRSRSVSEFWRRWHISLSTWFRDYLYIPLGGNHGSARRTYLNLVIVFFLCGLWHGASWTFVIWGLHHGALLILERAGLGRYLAKLPSWVARIYTLLAVMTGWVWFRATDFSHALSLFKAMLGLNGFYTLSVSMHLALYTTTVLALITGIVLAFAPDSREHHQKALKYSPSWIQVIVPITDTIMIISLFVLSLLIVGSGAYNPFLYFRF